MTHKKLLCDTTVLYPRLRNLGVRKPIYLWAFQELIINLKSDEGIVRDSDLVLWWPNISESTRYQILRILVFYKIINIEKDSDDRRQRHIVIIVKYQDTLYSVNN